MVLEVQSASDVNYVEVIAQNYCHGHIFTIICLWPKVIEKLLTWDNSVKLAVHIHINKRGIGQQELCLSSHEERKVHTHVCKSID